MGLRHRSIRLRIFLLVAVPILSLVGLYVFAAAITASDALNLARSRTLKDTIGTPTGNLEAQIDTERLIAVVYLAAPVPSNLAGLRAQEAKTRRAQKAFVTAVDSAATTSAAPAEKHAIAVLVKDTAGLAALRTDIASLAVSRPQAISAYATINSAADDVLNQTILQESNVPLVSQSLALGGPGRGAAPGRGRPADRGRDRAYVLAGRPAAVRRAGGGSPGHVRPDRAGPGARLPGLLRQGHQPPGVSGPGGARGQGHRRQSSRPGPARASRVLEPGGRRGIRGTLECEHPGGDRADHAGAAGRQRHVPPALPRRRPRAAGHHPLGRHLGLDRPRSRATAGRTAAVRPGAGQ